MAGFWLAHGLLRAAVALDNGVAELPRMGWSSWNYYGDTINETLIRAQADALVATGLRDLGCDRRFVYFTP